MLADDADQSLSAEESAADGSGDECLPSFHGLGKGYRFFKDGHVQSIQHHSLPDSPGLCYVRAQVLPSMVKTKKYSVKLYLTGKGDVHTAYCVCPAGLVVVTMLQHSSMHWRNLYSLACERRVNCHVQVISSSGIVLGVELFLHVESWMLQ